MKFFNKKKADKLKQDKIVVRRTLFGVIVVIVGVGLLLQNLFSWFSFNYAWPFIIIAVGLHLLRGRK